MTAPLSDILLGIPADRLREARRLLALMVEAILDDDTIPTCGPIADENPAGKRVRRKGVFTCPVCGRGLILDAFMVKRRKACSRECAARLPKWGKRVRA